MERPSCCTSTWVEEPCTLFHGYRGSGQALGYDILCFPGLGVVDWLQALRRHWATALKPQHVFLHGEGHSQSVLPGLARSTMQLLLAHMLDATAQPLLLSGQTCSLPLQFWDTDARCTAGSFSGAIAPKEQIMYLESQVPYF